MKAVTCKESRRVIEEAALDQQLSPEVLSHLRMCLECESFSEERTKLRQLVARVGTVVAPPDFDFRLRARLADMKSKPAPITGRLSLAAPAFALVVLVMVLGVLYGWRMVREPEKERPIAATPPVGQVREPETPTTPERLTVSEQAIPKPQQVKHSQSPTTRSRQRTEAKDFSNTLAPVVKRGETIASMSEIVELPIGTNHHSLSVSLDDGSGNPRTISLPRVSFGSERILISGFAPATKTSSGIW